MPLDYSLVRLPIIEARVDWLTATAPRGERGLELVTWAALRHQEEVDLGNKQERWDFSGYHGWQAGQFRYGWGENGAIVVASGERAWVHAVPLAARADHWSRIDYALTVVDQKGEFDITGDGYECLARAPRNLGSDRYYSLIQNSEGGSTLTIGRRSSASYIRIYNKHVESGGAYPAGSWRFEVELKRHASELQHSRWKEKPLDGKTCIGIVAGHVQRAGLVPPFDTGQIVHPDAYPRREPDADRALRWLEEQVAPTVEWVKEARGSVQVREALGL